MYSPSIAAKALQELVDRLARLGTIDILGNLSTLLVTFDRADPFTREECPAVNVRPGTEDFGNHGAVNNLGFRTSKSRLRVEFEIVARGDPSVLVTDTVHMLIHDRLMSERTLGDIVHSIEIVNRRWQRDSADQTAGVLIVGYDIIYTVNEKTLA